MRLSRVHQPIRGHVGAVRRSIVQVYWLVLQKECSGATSERERERERERKEEEEEDNLMRTYLSKRC